VIVFGTVAAAMAVCGTAVALMLRTTAVAEKAERTA
jgi:hypothetical protein